SGPPLVRLRRGASRPSSWWHALPRTPLRRLLVLTPRRASPGLPAVCFPHPYFGGCPVPAPAPNPPPPAPPPPRHPPPPTPPPPQTGPPHPAPSAPSPPPSPSPPRHAGGVDLGLRSHWAAAPPLPDGTPQVAEFDTDTDGLEALADWLQHHGVTTVALEATGVYWEPLFALLEARGFAVILVAPTYTSGIKGRPKTDPLHCHGTQRLHAHGLLPASFRPTAAVAVLRHYLRQRAELVRNGARHLQHLQKALEQRNVKLPEVLSDLTGLTGRKILQAI